MQYKVISADCHIDLIWLPPDLFTANAGAAFKDRMPYVAEGPRGREWVTKNGASFGLDTGMGSAGRKYEPGKIHRSDRMASTGLYDAEQQKIRRLTDPDLRLKDQDRDGIQAEVLYGVLGATMRLNDDEAAAEVLRIYNEWLAGFCKAHPDRYAGLANIPNHSVEAAVGEIERVARRGNVKGLEISRRHDMTPLWDPWWNPVWDAAAASGLPMHFHTIGGPRRDFSQLTGKVLLAARAASITSFQMHMAEVLMSIIFAGVLEHRPNLKVVIGESGTGWIPYILDRMDAEWEDQFKELDLTMKPSEYWRRQCYATYQSDPIGVKLIDELGVDNIMWGSDFPHPDGIYPDSQEYIQKELGHLPEATRKKIVCDNAAKLYRFVN
ncbi:MAG TPA: amidohydrolase family protein [Stellaceae bacterium]|jgi:predicted TIM-barrel fold metal-dependent hydrolase|nr:amidohydrolase family protein [Stellaceae bacterium]